MRKLRQLRNLAMQANAEGDANIYFGFIAKEDAKRKALKAKQKASRKANRKK